MDAPRFRPLTDVFARAFVSPAELQALADGTATPEQEADIDQRLLLMLFLPASMPRQ